MEMMHAREVEHVLEDMIAPVEGVRRAGLVGEAVADILARPQFARRALPVFRHDADGRLLEQFRRVRVRRAFEIGDDGQRLVLDPDRGERPVGRAFVLRGDGGDDIAFVAHLVGRDDRLVLDEIAVGRHRDRRRLVPG